VFILADTGQVCLYLQKLSVASTRANWSNIENDQSTRVDAVSDLCL